MGIAVLLIFAAILLGSFADEALEEFASGNHKFTADIYKVLSKTEKGNIVVSSISAEIVLALLTDGARCSTKEELISGLRLPPDQTTRDKAIRSLVTHLSEPSKYFKLLSANKVYVAQSFEVNSTYQKVAVDLYKAGLQNINFGDKVKAASIINKWVEEQTNNRIQNLIKPDYLTANTVLVLVNALYFSGQWKNPFNDKLTKKGPFYVSENQTKSMDMMHAEQVVKFRHCGYLKAKFLELPFNGSNISMTFILPDARDGLQGIESRLDEYLVPHEMKNEKVSITLPQFNINTEINFIPILKSLGIKKVFNPGEADLSGISKNRNLHVQFVQQKAFINVTASGVEAAAATAVGAGRLLEPSPSTLTFLADHPFIYYIKDCKSDVILFIGRLFK